MSDSEITKYEGEQPDERPGEDQTHPEGTKPPSEIGHQASSGAHHVLRMGQWQLILPDECRELERAFLHCSNEELLKLYRYLQDWDEYLGDTENLSVLKKEMERMEASKSDLLQFLRILAIFKFYTGYHLHHPDGKGDPTEGTGCSSLLQLSVEIKRGKNKHYMRVDPIKSSNGAACTVRTKDGNHTLTPDTPLIIGRNDLDINSLFNHALPNPIIVESNVKFKDEGLSRAALMLSLQRKQDGSYELFLSDLGLTNTAIVTIVAGGKEHQKTVARQFNCQHGETGTMNLDEVGDATNVQDILDASRALLELDETERLDSAPGVHRPRPKSTEPKEKRGWLERFRNWRASRKK